MLQKIFKALQVLLGPYVPIIPLGRGPCGHVNKAVERRRRGVMEGSEKRKVAEDLFLRRAPLSSVGGI